MGHKTPHQGARCGRQIEIDTRSTRLIEAAADCVPNARCARGVCEVRLWLRLWRCVRRGVRGVWREMSVR
eukprot:scaffold37946_cov72-Phaeocystis_antarctica.AAC.2